MDAGDNHPADGRDWMAAPLSDLVQHILDTHHRYLREALPRLSRLSEEAVQVQRTFESLRAELESHMWKEEMVLFPLVLGLEEARMSGRPAPPSHCGSIRNPIRVMEQEHTSANEALAELRRLSDGYTPPGDAGDNFRALYTGLAELEADLHRHIDLENDHLFPRAAELEAALA
jgi:regulator of cell morphogenesis and NO signaling